MAWFRLHTSVLNDPKVQLLKPELFKFWINLLCMAKENGGDLPDITVIAWTLREPVDLIEKQVEELVINGLIDKKKNNLRPHNWDFRQFKSDVSTERVKRFRKRRKEQGETVSRNAPQSTETETETETEVESATASYAWKGKVIRLNQADYDFWRKSFYRLDLDAELLSRDLWLAEQPESVRKKWFGSTATLLRNRNAMMTAATAPPRRDARAMPERN